MGLQVWLPLNGDLRQQGLSSSTVSGFNVMIDDNGKIGSCYSFNGSSYLFSNNSPFSNTTDDWSYACWFKPNKQHQGCLFSDRTAVSEAGMTIFYYGSSLIFDDGGRWQFTPSKAITVGSWNHLVFVRQKGVGKKFYLNGELINSSNVTYDQTAVSSNNFMIGASQKSSTDASGNYLNGYLNDVRIYDHALSPREVKEISKGLVLHYPLSMPGQENLLVPQISDNKWVNWRANATWDSTNTREKIVGDDGKTWAHIIQNTTAGYGGYACDPSSNQIVIDSSKRYTWSCIAKAGAKENAEIILWCHWRSTEGGSNLSQNSKKFQLTSNPQRISWTLPQYTNNTYTVNRINLMMGTSGTGNNEIYFTDVKFERGSRPTPWLPNPADPLYSSLGFNDGIEYDVSGYNRNGTKHGITYDSDTPRYQTCAVLDGTSYIKIDTNEWMVHGAQALTWSIWAYSDDWSTETDGGRLVSCTESGGFNIEGGASGYLRVPFYVFKDSEGSSKGYVYYNSSIQLASLTPGWHLFTTTYSTEAIKTYVDGALTYSYSYTSYGIGFNKNARLFLGCEAATANPGGAYFNGKLSDFRLYYTTLSAEDVYNLYAVGASLSDTGVLFSNEVSEV